MTYDFQSIIDYIVIISPTIAAVCGVIVGFIKIVKASHNSNKKIKEEIAQLREEFKSEREALEAKNADLKDALVMTLQSNDALKKQNEELKVLLTNEKRG